ncbi:sulfur oxidation c-type cytochrome SoxX [Halotia wernerae UHCC 0503]|jgi:L-cysteine S-thiosulfotransferase|nr:sulfur oxidation c-type cytochrome SoxX [Halotia wernerae UHCC 0503]
MNLQKTTMAALVALAALAGVFGANAQTKSSWGPGADDAAFAEMLRTGFKNAGTVTVERLKQDETQAFCSDPETSTAKDSVKRAEAIEAANLSTVKWPSDGKFLGDWKAGEALAQSGRGLTWTDGANQANGGNCYNCHQIDAKEISYGTIGPSLHQYGKLRGNTEEVQRATWAKIFNSKAANACSNMPRAGHMGILSEKGIKDIMALLLDPESPVNK